MTSKWIVDPWKSAVFNTHYCVKQGTEVQKLNAHKVIQLLDCWRSKGDITFHTEVPKPVNQQRSIVMYGLYWGVGNVCTI